MTSPVLRPYQAEAAAAALASHRAGENPVVSSPTGSGKSMIVGQIVTALREVERDRGSSSRRIVVTVPSRELAEQNERALRLFLPRSEVGVMCAALGRREIEYPVVIGTPQSLAGTVAFDPACVVVDEAHQMPLHRGSWFHRLFDALPRGRRTPRIGLSATTFRTADGAIYGSPAAWFTAQPFEVGVQELVDQGYLAPARYVAPGATMTTRGVSRSAGDYNGAQLVRANAKLVADQAGIIIDALKSRRKAMVFAVTVEHATAFRDAIRQRGTEAVLIVGTLSAAERDAAVEAFAAGPVPIAITVSAALTGFDVPAIDIIASCRPTTSPIIHTQSIGRGTRVSPGKTDCLVLDFAGNVPRFGPVHQPHFDRSGQPLGGLAPWRPCRACGTFNQTEELACTFCGAALVIRRPVTPVELEYGTISWGGENRALAALVEDQGWDNLPVEALALHAYRKRSDPTSVSCMLSFSLGGEAIARLWFKSMHAPRWKAMWLRLLGSQPVPRSLEEAFRRRHELIRPASIGLEKEDGFWRVTGVDYADDEDGGRGLLEAVA